MDLQDQILSVVLDTQREVKDLGVRMERVETVQEKVYNKLDGFMLLVNRHEAEIAAVRSSLRRLEERIQQLETSRA
ncbi:hypothetical protein HZA87_04975 [Candidatus Uhrbacteria bacterium]|nr:hypothetical protein [Candidatus Uhrbacteria bacterium]